MRLKIFFLFLFFLFNFSLDVSAAIALKNKEAKEKMDSRETKKDLIFSFKKSRGKFKKRKFRLQNLFKWKKNKKTRKRQTEKKNKKIVDPFALLGGLSGILALVIFLATAQGGYILLLLLIGGFFGMIGLKRIRSKPERRKGEFLAWIGIVGFLLLVIAFGLFLFLEYSDFF